MRGQDRQVHGRPVGSRPRRSLSLPLQILITTNGGTVWRNVPVTYDQTTLYAAYAMSPAQGARVYGANQAGESAHWHYSS